MRSFLSLLLGRSPQLWNLCLGLSLLAMASCEKEVSLDLGQGEPRLVVEGLIETGLPPVVILTQSFGFLEPIDPATLAENLVQGAVVTVSNGMETITLSEGVGGAFAGIYTVDTLAGSPYFVGEEGRFYDLRIEWNGEIYEARTKIPYSVPIDSLYAQRPYFPPQDDPNARSLGIRFKDPDTLGNYWRYFTRLNQGPLLPGSNSVISDEYSNGTEIQSLIPIGVERGSSSGLDSAIYAQIGDTVLLKWAAIDRATYDFWNTYEFSLATVGSPFAAPIQVKTNLSNGALGIWAGYGTRYGTLVITE